MVDHRAQWLNQLAQWLNQSAQWLNQLAQWSNQWAQWSNQWAQWFNQSVDADENDGDVVLAAAIVGQLHEPLGGHLDRTRLQQLL